MTTPPTSLDPHLRRILGASRLWFTAGSALLWLLVFGIGTVLVAAVVRGPPDVGAGMAGFAALTALIGFLLLMGGVAIMALTLTEQSRAASAVLDGTGSIDDVLRLGRRFWWTFALTLLTVSFVGCGALGAGATAGLSDAIEQFGQPEEE